MWFFVQLCSSWQDFNWLRARAVSLWQLSYLYVAAMVGNCSGGWQSNFGNEYCFIVEKETQAVARNICHGMNSELASITSDAECDYVADLMSVNFCRLSLTNVIILCTEIRQCSLSKWCYANARQDTNVSLWKCINYRQADIENPYFTRDGSIQHTK